MNPNSGNSGEGQNSVELPGLSGEELQADQAPETSLIKSPENKPQTQSIKASSQAASAIALPSQNITSQLTDDSSKIADDPAATHPAQDTDRIEKEWVDKAKAVVSKTKSDPYEQKTQMSRVKAEYIKSRFNKTVKSDDAVAR